MFNITSIIDPVQGTSILASNSILVLGFAALLLIVSFYVVFMVLKNFVANAIVGGVGLVMMNQLAPILVEVQVPISVTNIIIALIGGLPGLVIIGVLSFLVL